MNIEFSRLTIENVEDLLDQNEFDADKRIEAEFDKNDGNEKTEFDPDKRVENNDGFYSTYKERMDRTPIENGPRGEWTGDRGESVFIPSYQYIKEYLQNHFKLEGIDYKNAIPDFSPCSECTVEIQNMSEKRHGLGGNFNQCDSHCAELWKKEGKDGKSDWTARDVAEWREENKYSWHERNDMKTCDLIPTKVNDYFGHLGGVSECKKATNSIDSEGDFDE